MKDLEPAKPVRGAEEGPRVDDAEIETMFQIFRNNPERIGYLAYTLALDLRDARQEIARLQTLSQSQGEALNEMEAGRL